MIGMWSTEVAAVTRVVVIPQKQPESGIHPLTSGRQFAMIHFISSLGEDRIFRKEKPKTVSMAGPRF